MWTAAASRTGKRGIALASGLTVVASLIVLAPAQAADNAFPATALVAQQAIEDALTVSGATSVTGGLTDSSTLLWQGSAGVLDASGAPPSPTTMYGIGSTGKMFATAAVMQLVDQGKVGLDQPVVKYLPAFTMRSPQYRQITVRMLLDHSAGLPGSSYANGFTTVPYASYARDMLTSLATSELKTTPGAMSVYCNDCFTLAGEVVAAVSGMPFTEYVQRNLLAPMGMTHSQYVVDKLPAAGSVARVVRQGSNRPLEVTNIYASGGLMSTPADALSFARMLLNQGMSEGTRVLSAVSVAEMGRSQLRTTLVPVARNVWDYGLGWDTVHDLTLQGVGVRAWVKGGDTGDYHASLIVAPDSGLAAFVAGAGSFGSGTAQAAAERMLLSALKERGDIPAMPPQLGNEQPPPAVPTEDDVNAIIGTYLGTPGLAQRVVRGPGSSLQLQQLVDGAWTALPTTLSFRGDGAWWPDAPKPQSIRAVTGWGRTYLVVTTPTGYGSTFGDQVFGQRVQVSGRTAPAWRDRLGVWLFVNEGPTSTAWLGSPVTALTTIPGLPGYLQLVGMTPVDAHQPGIGTMFLQVPLMFGRDMDDLVPQGADLLRLGSWMLLRRDAVPALTRGENEIAIEDAGQAKWSEIASPSRLDVSGADAWYLYDSSFQLLSHGSSKASGVRAPAGSLLVVFGDAGGHVYVVVTDRR